MIPKDNSQNKRRKKDSAQQEHTTYKFESNSFTDMLSTTNHSDDFVQTRHGYIATRLWIMCLFFAISVPLFSLFDFTVFSQPLAWDLLVSRLTLSGTLVAIAVIVKQNAKINLIRLCLFASFILPTLFYLYTEYLFTVYQKDNIPIIFSSMPYLILAMLGLFPLTLVGSLLLIIGIFIPFFLGIYWYSPAELLVNINKVWLFVLFAGISLWLQSGQLSMLMKLYRECTIDPLTKLYNRRVLVRRAEYIMRKNQQFCVLMLDLDRFKRINDTYGHNAGDIVLVAVAKTMKKELRRTDIMARFGGEEFIAILPGASQDEAIHVANRIKMAIHKQMIDIHLGEDISVTCSIGVARARRNEDISDLLNRADDLLYQAKSSGRNAVISDKINLKKAV